MQVESAGSRTLEKVICLFILVVYILVIYLLSFAEKRIFQSVVIGRGLCWQPGALRCCSPDKGFKDRPAGTSPASLWHCRFSPLHSLSISPFIHQTLLPLKRQPKNSHYKQPTVCLLLAYEQPPTPDALSGSTLPVRHSGKRWFGASSLPKTCEYQEGDPAALTPWSWCEDTQNRHTFAFLNVNICTQQNCGLYSSEVLWVQQYSRCLPALPQGWAVSSSCTQLICRAKSSWLVVF